MNDRAMLEWLEAMFASSPDRDPWPPLAFLAGRDLEVEPRGLYAALRRAVLLVAAGGDPHRGIGLDDRAVTALADELERSELRAAFQDRLLALSVEGDGLPSVGAALDRMLADPERAWRAYACSLLAAELAE